MNKRKERQDDVKLMAAAMRTAAVVPQPEPVSTDDGLAEVLARIDWTKSKPQIATALRRCPKCGSTCTYVTTGRPAALVQHHVGDDGLTYYRKLVYRKCGAVVDHVPCRHCFKTLLPDVFVQSRK
jgi:hypothetical protein